MAAAQASLIAELEDALAHASSARGDETLRRIGDFFVAGASQFNDEHVAVFDRIIECLIDAAEPAALTALARRLAGIRNAPPDIVRRLAAHPDIAIAAPILARSTRLEERDLVEIAATESQLHKFAISGRTIVGENVADVLADCGDRHVARNLVMNLGAQLSPGAMANLEARAVDDPVLAEKLAYRPDTPPPVLRSLPRQASTQVCEHVGARPEPDLQADIIDPLVSKLRRDVAEAVEHAGGRHTVHALQRGGRVDEAHVRELAESGRVRATEAALAIMCEMSIEAVRRLTGDGQPDAALILCQSAGLAAATTHAIVRCLSGQQSGALIQTTLAEFDNLSPSAAEQIVALWRTAA